MCDPATIAAITAYAATASTVVAVGGAVYSADQARSNANKQADQARADAEAQQGAAEVEAGRIRKAAETRRSAAVAALAASGVDVSTGTSEQIQTDIIRRGEEDALNTMLTGSNRAQRLRQVGEMDQYAGSQLATGSVISGLSSVAGSARGWRYSNPTTAVSPWDLSNTTRGSGD